MLQKGFLKRHLVSRSINFGNKGIGNLVMYGGVLIILTSLFIMMFNLPRADSIIHIWLPFMIAGVILVFISILFRPQAYKSRH